MTALEAVVQHTQKHDHLTVVRTDHDIETVPMRPPQLNFAGWCNWCDDRWCTAQRCAQFRLESEWAVCDRCNGKGFDNPTSVPCTCCHGLAQTR